MHDPEGATDALDIRHNYDTRPLMSNVRDLPTKARMFRNFAAAAAMVAWQLLAICRRRWKWRRHDDDDSNNNDEVVNWKKRRKKIWKRIIINKSQCDWKAVIWCKLGWSRSLSASFFAICWCNWANTNAVSARNAIAFWEWMVDLMDYRRKLDGRWHSRRGWNYRIRSYHCLDPRTSRKRDDAKRIGAEFTWMHPDLFPKNPSETEFRRAGRYNGRWRWCVNYRFQRHSPKMTT